MPPLLTDNFIGGEITYQLVSEIMLSVDPKMITFPSQIYRITTLIPKVQLLVISSPTTLSTVVSNQWNKYQIIWSLIKSLEVGKGFFGEKIKKCQWLILLTDLSSKVLEHLISKRNFSKVIKRIERLWKRIRNNFMIRLLEEGPSMVRKELSLLISEEPRMPPSRLKSFSEEDLCWINIKLSLRIPTTSVAT